MSRRLLYGLMSLVVLMWGGAFVAIKFLLIEGLSAWTIALLRFGLTVMGLWIVVVATRTPMPVPERRHRPWIALMGLCGVAAYHLALNFGERYVSPNVAPLVIAAMPVVVAILATFLLHEHMDGVKWEGIALAIAGVVVLVLWGTPGAEISVRNVTGAAVIAISPIAWAVYTVLSKRLVGKYGALPLSTWAITTGTVLLVPFAIVPTVREIGAAGLEAWAWIAFLAFGCTVFAYVVWFRALQELDASRVAAWVYFVPLVAPVWGWIVLREPVTPFLAVGGVMVLGGVILIERVSPQMVASREADEAVAQAISL